VYHQRGLELLLDIIPAENVLFASEMIGAVRGVDPQTGHRFDDVKYLLDSVDSLSAADREAVYLGNALRVFGRLEGALKTVAARAGEGAPASEGGTKQ
jgi:4-oxalmesaconate hydratase